MRGAVGALDQALAVAVVERFFERDAVLRDQRRAIVVAVRDLAIERRAGGALPGGSVAVVVVGEAALDGRAGAGDGVADQGRRVGPSARRIREGRGVRLIGARRGLDDGGAGERLSLADLQLAGDVADQVVGEREAVVLAGRLADLMEPVRGPELVEVVAGEVLGDGADLDDGCWYSPSAMVMRSTFEGARYGARWRRTCSRVIGVLTGIIACACGEGASSTSEASAGSGVGGTTAAVGGSSQNVAGMIVDIGRGGAEGATAGRPGATCTSDLRRVVDGNGRVIKECPTNQGCAEGECIEACEAAARAKGSVGCEFWALTPRWFDSGLVQSGPCYVVVVANAWDRSAKLGVSRAGQNLDVTAFARIPRGAGVDVQYEPLPETGVPPNEVAVLFLSNLRGSALRCPITPAVLEPTAIWGAERGAAFRVTSDTPVSAYAIIPYGRPTGSGGTATLMLPVSTWGTNYTVLAPSSVGDGGLLSLGRVWAAVVASEDDTTVKVAPSMSLPGSDTLAPALAGEVTEYVLQAGEAMQWIEAMGLPSLDPSGTIIDSDKPIGLWTGNTALTVSSATSPMSESQDATHQQVPPIRALGSEYVGGGIVTRHREGLPESVPYRLMGVVDGTKLEWDPEPPDSAPLELNQGEVVDFESTEPFSVRSQGVDHPFVFTQFMPGSLVKKGECPGTNACGLGDVEWVNLVPAEQFLRRYVFFIDPTYPTTNLVVVRRRTDSGFHDVELQCLGTLAGWRPVGNGGMFEVAHVDLVRAGVPVGSCSSARHVASSEGPFGIVVWGLDAASSYAYPAGGNFGAINDVVVPPVIR